jgi:hypothetical protein
MDSISLEKMTETQMMARVNSARFPQELTAPDKKLLAMVAITYGFDPLMGEITIYQGRPYVSIDGRYRKAQETGNLCGVKTRPATEQERKDWQIPEGDYFYHAEVYVKGGGFNFFEGWGRVKGLETKPGSSRQGDTTSTYKPIQSNPQRMAEKRAEAFALRKAFHINLPSKEDIGSPDEEVDTVTGEIVEGHLADPPDTTKAKRDITNLYDDGQFKPSSNPESEKAFDNLESANPPIPATMPATEAKQAVEPSQEKKASPATPKAKTGQIPTTKNGLMNWIYAHRVKATFEQVATWITNPVTNQPYKDLKEVPDTPEAIAAAYGEIKNRNGWED